MCAVLGAKADALPNEPELKLKAYPPSLRNLVTSLTRVKQWGCPQRGEMSCAAQDPCLVLWAGEREQTRQ